MAEVPFNGYMPLSKVLDYLHGELDRRGDIWVSVMGTLHTSQKVEYTSETTAAIEPEEK